MWTPARHAQRARHHKPGDLARRLDAVIAALSKGRRSIAAELSGGLDPSIVAVSLKAAGAALVGAVNQASPRAEGDERRYAEAVAQQLEVPLTVMPRSEFRFDLGKLERCAGGLRPPYNAQDPDFDQAMAEWLEATDAEAVFTGHGGDAVFFQMRVPAVATDLLLGAGRLRHRRAAFAAWAHRSRVTAWRLVGQALGEIGRQQGAIPAPEYLGLRTGLGLRHPWLRNLRGLTPGKRYQVWTVTNTQTLIGDSLHGQVADLIHPLLAQPIVELCLQTPLPTLAIGARDRPFARAAFADRLPPVVAQRRGKGDVTHFYARSVAASLDVLRPLLLDGRLAAEGLIDRDRLAPLLDAEAMIWRNAAGPIMRAVFLEVWVRRWEAQIAAAAERDPPADRGRPSFEPGR